jgi:carbonic anhydrase
MARVARQRDDFVRGLVERAGWDEARAERHFAEGVAKFSIDNEVDFVMREVERLRGLYPKITVVPLLYRVEDDLLYQLKG